MDLAKLRDAHAARLASVDPLLPVPVTLEGEVLIVGTAAGTVAKVTVDPDSLDATWGALERHRLTAQLADGGLGPLLDRWEEHLREVAEPGDPDVAAQINWPSRDTAEVAALVRHGFAPLITIAVRKAGVVSGVPADPDVLVREATKADFEACIALNVALVRYDAQFGAITERPSTESALRAELTDLLGRDPHCVWVAERGGELLGLATVDFPPHSNWIAGTTRLTPAAYIGILVVAAHARGGGVGGALIRHVHRVLDEEGIAATLLHHALPNPRSTPFWYGQGYRPLWTSWQRRPALRS